MSFIELIVLASLLLLIVVPVLLQLRFVVRLAQRGAERRQRPGPAMRAAPIVP
jgi:hypothetical protein